MLFLCRTNLCDKFMTKVTETLNRTVEPIAIFFDREKSIYFVEISLKTCASRGLTLI